VTVAGLKGGTQSYTYSFAAGALVPNQPLIVQFAPSAACFCGQYGDCRHMPGLRCRRDEQHRRRAWLLRMTDLTPVDDPTNWRRLPTTPAASRASRLSNGPFFRCASRSAPSTALIATEWPTDVEGIRTRQAEIKAIDGFCQELASAILRAPRKPMAVA
jgi:hypothetical protein